MSSINKVDMSLDEIIKLNKKQNTGRGGRGKLNRMNRGGTQKVKQFHTNLRGARGGGRGMGRGQGRGITRGQGRGTTRGQGRGTTRGQGRGAARGRGSGRGGRGQLVRQLSNVSPLNRIQDHISSNTSQRRGQGRQTLSKQRIQAVNALRKAKQQLAVIDAQTEKRQATVDERRGLLTNQQQTSNFTSNRGRGGRGRGGRGRLSRQNLKQPGFTTIAGVQYGYNQNVVRGRGRGRGRGRLQRIGNNTNSADMNLAASLQNVNTINKRRQWRKKTGQYIEAPSEANDGIMKISLHNTDYQPVQEETTKTRSQSFNYNKKLFALSGNNKPLSQRFQSTASTEVNDRQVFL